MAEIIETTAKQAYPLPNAANVMSRDVARIAAAIRAIDHDVDALEAGKANAHDAVLTGTPTAPTPTLSVRTTQIATMEAVHLIIDGLVNGSPEVLDTLREFADAINNDPNFATTVITALAGKQPLDAALTSLASLALPAGKMVYTTALDTFSTADLTSIGRAFLAFANYQAAKDALAIAIADVAGLSEALGTKASTSYVNSQDAAVKKFATARAIAL